MKNNLPYPFNIAFEGGHSIDYRCKGGKDHAYVKERGFESHMNSDCSYTAKGLNGFSLSSYGDWGTFHADWAGDKEKEMFLDMVDKGIIELWRIRAYIHVDGELNPRTYDYDNTDDTWITYNKEQEKWVKTKDPFSV